MKTYWSTVCHQRPSSIYCFVFKLDLSLILHKTLIEYIAPTIYLSMNILTFLLTVFCRFCVICMLQSLGMYIKSKQEYERERSLYITSILLTECLSCAVVLAVSLSSVELICLGFYCLLLLALFVCHLV